MMMRSARHFWARRGRISSRHCIRRRGQFRMLSSISDPPPPPSRAAASTSQIVSKNDSAAKTVSLATTATSAATAEAATGAATAAPVVAAGTAVRKIVGSVALWAGGGLALNTVLVKALAFSGAIYYPTFFLTTALVATTVTMVPLGAVRGSCNAAEYTLVPATGLAAAQTWDLAAASAESVGLLNKAGIDVEARAFRELLRDQLASKSLLSDVLNTSGIVGAPIRLLASAFLPSTDVIVDQLVLSSRQSATTGTTDGSILVAAAANGLVVSHLTNVRDKATALALAVLGLAVMATAISDQTSGRAAAKAQDTINRASAAAGAAKDAAMEGVELARGALDNATDSAGTVLKGWRNKAGKLTGSKTSNEGDDESAHAIEDASSSATQELKRGSGESTFDKSNLAQKAKDKASALSSRLGGILKRGKGDDKPEDSAAPSDQQ